MSGIDRALDTFVRSISDTKSWLGNTELLWKLAPRDGEVRRKLGRPQLEALHEAAFIRAFGAWEVFQEDLLICLMRGQTTVSYPTLTLPAGKTRALNIAAARADLFGGQQYLLWHNPSRVARRAARFVANSPLELVVTSNEERLTHFANVRHRIAHASEDARSQFMISSAALCGLTHDGVAGRFLRSMDNQDGLNYKLWFLVICDELLGYATEMAS